MSDAEKVLVQFTFQKSSLSTRTRKIQIPIRVSGFFNAQMGLERPLRKCAGGTFLGRGRVLPFPDASRRDVDGNGNNVLIVPDQQAILRRTDSAP